MIEFRALGADEIDVRVAKVSEKGISLLLYKDARCDMNILDETVGPERWQRHHELINGNLFCNVGINFPSTDGFERWVWKQDVGTESYTEKEKGQASDSFKRACFNWGIGRELYTAPFIWVYPDKCKIERGPKGNLVCKDTFRVKEIAYDNKKIIKIVIINEETKTVVFTTEKISEPKETPKSAQIDYRIKLNDMLIERGIDKATYCKEHKLTKASSQANFKRCCEELVS